MLPFASSLDTREQLEWERELLGLYVSDHPLSPYLPALRRKITHFSAQLGGVHDKEKVTVAGMVTRFRQHQTKTGKAMGFVTLEDIQGLIELVLFPRTWDRFGKLITPDRVLVAEGRVDAASGDPKVLVDRLDEIDLEEALNVKEIDGSAFIPPAVLAVYGEKGMPAHFEPEEDAPDSDLFSGETDGSESFSNERRELPGEQDDEEGLPQEPPQGAEDTAPILQPIGKPAAYTSNDDEPPLWPDDWDQFESPTRDDYFQPAQPGAAANLAKAGAVQATENTSTLPPTETTASEGESAVLEQTVRAQFSSSSTLPGKLPAGEIQAPPFLSMPFFVSSTTLAISPAGDALELEAENAEPRQLNVILRSSNDKAHDVRRLRRIHGTLRSFPGKDKFAFLVFEGGRRFLMEFPNDTTGICSELIRKLIELVGEGNVSVEPIKIQ
jgi:DNA polymerase-3 subunit alpha